MSNLNELNLPFVDVSAEEEATLTGGTHYPRPKHPRREPVRVAIPQISIPKISIHIPKISVPTISIKH